MNAIDRFGSFARAIPIFSIWRNVSGPVPSCTYARSTGLITMSPAFTGRPTFAERIFSTSV